jgi:hypothetical protein
MRSDLHRATQDRKINLSGVFSGQDVGILEVSEKIWLVSFMQYDLGFFDHQSGRVECAPNPFGAKVFLAGINPMCPERTVESMVGVTDLNLRLLRPECIGLVVGCGHRCYLPDYLGVEIKYMW